MFPPSKNASGGAVWIKKGEEESIVVIFKRLLRGGFPLFCVVS
jgi:hypothetical protein